MFIKTEPIPMTGSARDSLIAISVLWILFAVTVGFRFLGRIRGIGLGLDDILSAVALVSNPEVRPWQDYCLRYSVDLIWQYDRHERCRFHNWRWYGCLRPANHSL